MNLMHFTVGKIMITVAVQYRVSNVFFCLNTGSMGLKLTWGKQCVSAYFQCMCVCCTVIDKSHTQGVNHIYTVYIQQDYKPRKQEVFGHLFPVALY
jgi:hypothetical protein